MKLVRATWRSTNCRSRAKDEIAMLAGSFNRMYVSLRKAIKMLEE